MCLWRNKVWGDPMSKQVLKMKSKRSSFYNLFHGKFKLFINVAKDLGQNWKPRATEIDILANSFTLYARLWGRKGR